MAPMEKARQEFFAKKQECAKALGLTGPSSEDYIRAKFLVRKSRCTAHFTNSTKIVGS